MFDDTSIPVRIVLAKLGFDGHDRGLKIVARMLRDAGFEVIYLGLRQTTDSVIAAAEQEDADVIGISMLNGGHMTLGPKMVQAVRAAGLDTAVVVGGIVPDDDVPVMKDAGVAEILTPGASADEVAAAVHRVGCESGDGVKALAFDPIAEAHRQWVAHGWDEAADGMAAVTSIVRAQQIVLRRVHDALAAHGLTLARYEVLRLLAFSRDGELPLGKMGARLQVHAGSITNAVDKLEADGLVERHAHAGDGRVVLARITPVGRTCVEAATVPLNKAFGSFGIAESDLRQLVEIVGRLREANGDFADN